jgi:thiol-disulfide isomerase/thioredoxin
MKKKSLLTLLVAVCLAAGAKTKGTVIDRPAFKQATSLGIIPVKVQLTKDATIVHFRIRYATKGGWSLDGAQLKADGQTFACQKGRIITHEGKEVLADEAFEFEKEYEKDAMKDSVILYFNPLPTGTKTFDFIEDDDPRSWNIFGIRLDNKLYPELLPAYQPRKDNGKPLEPLTLKYGEAKATITMHGESIKGIGWFEEKSSDPITNEYKAKTTKDDFTLFYSQPAYSTVEPRFTGAKVDINGQFPMYLIPGETVTLDIDPVACLAMLQDFAAGKPVGYRVGGTIGDLNQVLLDNLDLYYYSRMKMPSYAEVRDFPEWRNGVWQTLNTLRQEAMKRKDYTRRQKDFFSLLIDRAYVLICLDYIRVISSKERLANPDSTLAHLKKTYTLVDPHAKEMQFGRDGRSFYFPLDSIFLPYWEANGLNNGEVYEMTKSFAKAQAMGEKMNNAEVQLDSVIQSVHPHFQPVLLALNDSTRVLAERLQREAKNRIMKAPDVPADQLLQAIVKEYPGKVVFFDLWATWCGPCKKGIEAMEPLKEELKEEDVVFVYLTDGSSPTSAWNDYVLKVPGKHYRIDSLSKIPGLTGIPQYYLYDRQGKQVWEQSGFSDEVLKDIEAQITRLIK